MRRKKPSGPEAIEKKSKPKASCKKEPVLAEDADDEHGLLDELAEYSPKMLFPMLNP